MKSTPMAASINSLGCVPSTLLIPLAARSLGALQFPHLDPHDQYATAALDALETNVHRYLGDWATVLNVLWRTHAIKETGSHFFAQHPHSYGVNLGSGLSKYFQWFDNGTNHWVDADLAEVMSLRQLCLQMLHQHRQDKTIDITEAGWWKRLGLPTGKRARPVFLICEGVLIYLTPQQVHSVLEEVGESAPPDSEIIFDVMSPLGVGKAAFHTSVGQTGAQFTWGENNAEKIASASPRLKVVSQRSVSEAYGFTCGMAELMFAPFLGGPMYGLVHLGLRQ